jgi:hypothetical protein
LEQITTKLANRNISDVIETMEASNWDSNKFELAYGNPEKQRMMFVAWKNF